jgi:drug/metabolite transporter superfamily protein YnfA
MTAWAIFLAAAILEVVGDAMIRRGLRSGGLAFLLAGCLLLGAYGLVVNLVRWDFSRLLGVYVAVFATVGVLCGRFVFGDRVPASTWLGLAIVIVGGLVIQLGPRFQ